MKAAKSRWLVLSHAFNMDGRAASHTVTDKLEHLKNAGIEVVILSGVSGIHAPLLDHHQLWSWGAAGFRFELRHVLQKKWGKNLSYRVTMLVVTVLLSPVIFFEKLWRSVESSWLWWLPAWQTGRRLHKAKPFDLIYSSGGALSAHQAAWKLKKELSIPWLAEIHDPMVMPGAQPQTSQEKLQARLEELICRDADVAIWFTDQALASARQRHPSLGQRGHAILPGVDAPKENLPFYKAGEKLVLAHFGSLSPTRHLGPILQALAKLQVQHPMQFQDFQLHIYGGGLDSVSKSLLEASPVAKITKIWGRIETDPISGESGRTQILKRMRQADVLLLLHGHEAICAEYIPSKTYEYLWMQRPILAVVHQNPQMKKILQNLNHAVVGSGDVDALVEALSSLHQQWCSPQGLSDLPYGHSYTTQAAVARMLNLVSSDMRQK